MKATTLKGKALIAVVGFTLLASLGWGMNPVAAGAEPAAAQQPLQQAAQAFARAWGAGSADQLASFLAPSGVRLQLDGSSHGSLSARQALAALRDFHRGYQGGSASVARAAPVDGSPDRGFAEIQWTARMAGTSEVVRRNVFVGMRLEPQGWRVDEVRLLR